MVEIRGGGTLDGAQLIDAASDSTLRELITTIQMQGQQAKAAQVDQTAKQVKAADIDALTESTKKSTKQFDDTKESTKSFKEKLDEVAKSLGSASATLASKGITSLFDFFSTGMDSFRQLSTIGTGFNGNLTELSSVALNAGRSVSDFSKIVMENSTTLTALGGSAEGGARKLAEISGLLTQGQLLQRMSAMGMTMKDIDQATQAYMESQMRLGTLTRQNASAIAEHTAQFSEGLDGVSRALGLNRSALEKASVDVAKDPVMNQFVQNIREAGGNAEKAFQNLTTLTAAGGDKLANAFVHVSNGLVGNDTLAQALSGINGSVRQTIANISKGNTDFASNAQYLKEAAQSQLRGLTESQIEINPRLLELKKFVIMMEQYGNVSQSALERAKDGLLASYDSFGGRLASLSTTMGTALNRLMGAIIDTDLFKSVEAGLNSLAKYLTSGESTQALRQFANGLMEAFQKVYSAMKEGWTNGTIWTAITAGLNSLWNDVGGVLEREFTNMFNRFFGGKPAAPINAEQQSNDAARTVETRGQEQRQSWDKIFTDAIESIRQKGLEFFHSLPTALTEGVNTARESLSSVFGMVSEFVSTLPERVSFAKKELQNIIDSISLDSIGQKISNFAKDINSSIQTIDLTKFNDFMTNIRGLSLSSLTGEMERVPGIVARVKESLTGFSDVVRIEIDKLNEIFKPGASGPEAIQNISRALMQFEGPLRTLINNISGLNGETAQTLTSSSISNVLTSITGFIEKTTQGIKTLENINPEQMQRNMGAIRSIGVEMRQFFDNFGVGTAWSTFIGNVSGAFDTVSENIKKLQNINVDAVNGIVTSMNQLKGIGASLGADIQGVTTFTESVSVLRRELEAGASAAERIKAAAGSLPAGTGGIAGANNYNQIDPNQIYQTMRDINGSLGSLNNYLNTIAANSAAPRAPAVTR